MAIEVRNWEWTDCYQCEKRFLGIASAVHPLCSECEVGFDEWFNKQLEVFK